MKKYSRLSLYEIGILVVILVLVLVIKGVSDISKEPASKSGKESNKTSTEVHKAPSEQIVKGYGGVIAGISAVKSASSPYNAIGTTVEDVLVGQRVTEREIETLDSVGDQVKESIDDIGEQSWEIAGRTKISDGDYETLLAIVEAEAGGEDIEGRMMVANVILNRVKYPDAFPNNVTDVVWEKVGGAAQFSPTIDGRIGRVSISGMTREAVNRVIDGEDLSQGALFFMAKAQAEEHNQKWFNGALKFLFEHGVHSFYTY